METVIVARTQRRSAEVGLRRPEHKASVSIAGREIGYHLPPYMVADIGANHGGDFIVAVKLIDAAAEAKADAVKLQTYTPQELRKRPNFEQYRAVYEKYHTPRAWHKRLFDHAAGRGITIFSSAFSVDGVKFLDGLGAPAIKIAAAEARDMRLLDAALTAGVPVIVSNGVIGNIALHCVSEYPASIENANLGKLADFKCVHDLVGLSDHTPDDTTAIMATAFGVVMIEKHLKLDDNCVDAAFSLNPEQFAAMCRKVRAGWEAMQ